MSSPTSRPPLSPKPTATLTMPSHLPPNSSHGSRPWYTHITLDMLVHILARSVFHPAIVLIGYLCIAAMHKHRTAVAAGTLYWASALLAWRVLGMVSERAVYGRRRTVQWGREVVVVTGGARGLGRALVEGLLARYGGEGVRVAIVDLVEPESTEDREWLSRWDGRVWWGCCDVRNSGGVRVLAGRIREELGRPTMLINNAATGVVGAPLIPSDYAATLTPQAATKTLTVNTLAHFNTLNAFLGDLTSAENGCSIVTISSLLAHLSPNKLADYSASKAALSSLHNTLTHEIAVHPSQEIREKAKTVLVEPGMMYTQLFQDITAVPWYANFFGPVLEVNEVAKAIIDQLNAGQSGVIRMPFYSKCMPFYSAMPAVFQMGMRWFSGIDRAIVPATRKSV